MSLYIQEGDCPEGTTLPADYFLPCSKNVHRQRVLRTSIYFVRSSVAGPGGRKADSKDEAHANVQRHTVAESFQMISLLTHGRPPETCTTFSLASAGKHSMQPMQCNGWLRRTL